MAAEHVLVLNDISRHFSTASGASLAVLGNISLEIAKGESLAVVGPSGSGKSTLLQIMGGLDQPTRGSVKLNGMELGQLSEEKLAEVRNSLIGFVFQSHYLLPQCTVMENALVPTLARGRKTDRAAAITRAKRLLERVGLAERLDHRPGQLSGGERQRVAVVRALINEPQILVADEPTGALDRASADALTQLLVELNQEEKVTLIVATHALELARRMKRILELRDGKLIPANV
jgi:ABC-type lipoprotein export system ATPase subunit